MTVQSGSSAARAARAARVGGWLLIALALLHLAMTTAQSGELLMHLAERGWWATVSGRPDASGAREATIYWATLGGFALPQLVLGVWALSVGRRGQRVPTAVAWAVTAVILVSLPPLGVNPSWLMVVPAGFLLFSAHARPRVAVTAQ